MAAEKIITGCKKADEKSHAGAQTRGNGDLNEFRQTDIRPTSPSPRLFLACPTSVRIILCTTTFADQLQYDSEQNLLKQVTAPVSCIMYRIDPENPEFSTPALEKVRNVTVGNFEENLHENVPLKRDPAFALHVEFARNTLPTRVTC